MCDVFSQSCSDLVGAYVKASLKRDHDAREIYLFLEERLRRDRRLMRRRIVRLEQEQAESYRSIEELVEEVERLNADLDRLRASPVDPVSPDCVCEPVAEACSREEMTGLRFKFFFVFFKSLVFALNGGGGGFARRRFVPRPNGGSYRLGAVHFMRRRAPTRCYWHGALFQTALRSS
jgi:hypothetical protein